MYTAISLGWGVQSFTMAAMSALGDLPRIDVAIHSDTTHERSATYRFAEQMTSWLEDHDIRVVTVTPVRTLALEQVIVKSVQIPSFTQRPGYWGYKKMKDGTRKKVWKDGKGQLRRQCTQRWKIAPMRKWLQANRSKQPVEMWLGISLDESERMKPSDVKYITNRFPLLEKRMSREDCKRYLTDHGLPIPVKSACVFCPFHDRRAWRELRETGNGDWHKAIQVDEAIRKARPPYDLYLHSSRKSLREIGDAIEAQPEFDLISEECSGVCFL